MRQIDVSTDTLERLWVLWTGFRDGADYASQHPQVNPYLDADRVKTLADQACERRRHTNMPLDSALVHPAYTYGWMAGYLAARRDFGARADGAPLTGVASVTASQEIAR